MTDVFHITRIEPTPRFVLYHLDAAKSGATAIVSFRTAPGDLEPTLATLHRQRVGFDFEIDPAPLPACDDPRLKDACQIRALTVGRV